MKAISHCTLTLSIPTGGTENVCVFSWSMHSKTPGNLADPEERTCHSPQTMHPSLSWDVGRPEYVAKYLSYHFIGVFSPP